MTVEVRTRRGGAGGGGGRTDPNRSEAKRAGAFVPGSPPSFLAVTESEDGEHVALVRQTLSGFEVVADGTRHAAYREMPGPLWSKTGGHVAYFATRTSDGTTTLVVDGRETKPDGRDLPPPAQPGVQSAMRPAVPPVWSQDGRHFAAGVTVSDERGSRMELWVDGERRAEFAHMDPNAVWSPDGSKLALVAMRGGQWSVWVDGWERGGYDAVAAPSLAWNDDGTVRYAATRSGKNVLFLGEREIEAPAPIVGPILRTARGKLAFTVFAARQQQLVVDDRIQSTHDAVQSLSVLPDGETFYFVATDAGKQRIVLLGKGETQPADRVVETSIRVRADGACLAWTELSTGLWWIVKDAVPGAPHACRRQATGPFTAAGEPSWTADGNLVFAAIDAGEPKLFVADREVPLGPLPENLLRVGRRSDGRLAHLAVSNGWIWRVVRAPTDRAPVDRIARGSERPRAPDAPGVSVVDVADLPAGAIQLVVHDATQHVAWLDPTGPQRRVFLDGRLLTESPFVSAPPAFSEDGDVLYTRGSPGQSQVSVMVNERAEIGLPGVVEARFTGRGSAFVVTHVQGNQYHVWSSVTRRSVAIGASPPAQLVPSPDGRRFAVVTPEFPARLLVDGRLEARGFPIQRPVWSDDGAHWMASVQSQETGRTQLFVDGRAIDKQLRIEPIGFDRAATPIYSATAEGGSFLVKGDRRGPTVRAVAAASAVFDASRSHVAYLASDPATGQMAVFRDADPVRGDLTAPCCMAWSPDGAHLAWVAGVADARAVLVDRAVRSAYDDVAPGTLRWSDDGRTLSYVALRRGGDSGEAIVVVGDDEHGPYDEVAPPGAVFHGSHAAWMARRGPVWNLVVDGRIVASVDDVAPGAKVTWTPEGIARVLALREATGSDDTPVRRIVSVRYDPRHRR